jgi:hypothetical protein
MKKQPEKAESNSQQKSLLGKLTSHIKEITAFLLALIALLAIFPQITKTIRETYCLLSDCKSPAPTEDTASHSDLSPADTEAKVAPVQDTQKKPTLTAKNPTDTSNKKAALEKPIETLPNRPEKTENSEKEFPQPVSFRSKHPGLCTGSTAYVKNGGTWKIYNLAAAANPRLDSVKYFIADTKPLTNVIVVIIPARANPWSPPVINRAKGASSDWNFITPNNLKYDCKGGQQATIPYTYGFSTELDISDLRGGEYQIWQNINNSKEWTGPGLPLRISDPF